MHNSISNMKIPINNQPQNPNRMSMSGKIPPQRVSQQISPQLPPQLISHQLPPNMVQTRLPTGEIIVGLPPGLVQSGPNIHMPQ